MLQVCYLPESADKMEIEFGCGQKYEQPKTVINTVYIIHLHIRIFQIDHTVMVDSRTAMMWSLLYDGVRGGQGQGDITGTKAVHILCTLTTTTLGVEFANRLKTLVVIADPHAVWLCSLWLFWEFCVYALCGFVVDVGWACSLKWECIINHWAYELFVNRTLVTSIVNF